MTRRRRRANGRDGAALNMTKAVRAAPPIERPGPRRRGRPADRNLIRDALIREAVRYRVEGGESFRAACDDIGDAIGLTREAIVSVCYGAAPYRDLFKRLADLFKRTNG